MPLLPFTPAEAGVLTIFLLAGGLVHELGHIFFGWLFGGQPFASEHVWKFPIQTDFGSPHAMANWQARVTGGFVYIFPLIAGYALWHHHLPLAAFALGGSAISDTDAVAFFHPTMWKKLTAGESVTRELWDQPPMLELLENLRGSDQDDAIYEEGTARETEGFERER